MSSVDLDAYLRRIGFAGAARADLAHPAEQIAAAVARERGFAGVRDDAPAARARVDVDADDDALRAESCRELVDQRRACERRAVDRNLVRSGCQHRFGVADRADAAGDAERDVQLARHAFDPGLLDAAALGARGDVVEDELVGTLVGIAPRERDDVADDAVVAKADALDDGAARDVEACDHAAREHRAISSSASVPSGSAVPATHAATPVAASASMSRRSRTPPDATHSIVGQRAARSR